MSALETKVPPPLVALVVAILAWAAARVLPWAAVPIPAPAAIGLAIAVAGAAVELAGAVSFVRARTTVNPLDPCSASALVTSGVYRVTRNPMYLGDLLILVGWAVYLSNVAALLIVPAFVVYIDRFQIAAEERALGELFGPPYEEFRGRVRRWL